MKSLKKFGSQSIENINLLNEETRTAIDYIQTSFKSEFEPRSSETGLSNILSWTILTYSKNYEQLMPFNQAIDGSVLQFMDIIPLSEVCFIYLRVKSIYNCSCIISYIPEDYNLSPKLYGRVMFQDKQQLLNYFNVSND
jgi:hypothetical protein